jgi:hypothetical protein
MKNKSANKCIEENDIETAYERYQSTTNRWKGYWWETIETIYKNCKELSKKYILDPIKKIITKICSPKRITNDRIFYGDNCIIQTENPTSQKCYLIEFLNEEKESLCSKVGTTTRAVLTRIKEELRSKTYKDMGAVYCVIHRVYDCGEYPAEGLESLFRAEYIRKYPNSFYKNDRFIKQKFDLAEADKICAAYFA